MGTHRENRVRLSISAEERFLAAEVVLKASVVYEHQRIGIHDGLMQIRVKEPALADKRDDALRFRLTT